jgi:hypothetical protein
MADGRERAFDDAGRAQMFPVLCGEVVEVQQRIAILDHALDRLVVFGAPGLDEGVERCELRAQLCAINVSAHLQRPGK